jgi:hypothetical protein
MRRVIVILLVGALGFAAAAGALPGPGGTQAGLGSLAVSGGDGKLVVKGSGVIYGFLEQGALLVIAYRPSDPTRSLVVEGAAEQQLPGRTTYAGSDVRFFLPSGTYIVEFLGTGLDLAAVGSGTILQASAAGAVAAGSVTLDGGHQLALDRVAAPTSFGGVGPGAVTTTTAPATTTTTTTTRTTGGGSTTTSTTTVGTGP